MLDLPEEFGPERKDFTSLKDILAYVRSGSLGSPERNFLTVKNQISFLLGKYFNEDFSFLTSFLGYIFFLGDSTVRSLFSEKFIKSCIPCNRENKKIILESIFKLLIKEKRNKSFESLYSPWLNFNYITPEDLIECILDFFRKCEEPSMSGGKYTDQPLDLVCSNNAPIIAVDKDHHPDHTFNPSLRQLLTELYTQYGYLNKDESRFRGVINN